MTSEEFVTEAVPPVPDAEPDPVLYRSVVWGLIAVAILTVIGGIGLAWIGQQIPDGLIAIGAGAGGALGGMLVQRAA